MRRYGELGCWRLDRGHGLIGKLETKTGRAVGEFSPELEMLEVPPDANAVRMEFPSENIFVMLAPVSTLIFAEARKIELAGSSVTIDDLRNWALPVLGPLFGTDGDTLRLARTDETTVEVGWLDEAAKSAGIGLETWIKEHLLGLRWCGNDWIPVGASPYAELAAPS